MHEGYWCFCSVTAVYYCFTKYVQLKDIPQNSTFHLSSDLNYYTSLYQTWLALGKFMFLFISMNAIHFLFVTRYISQVYLPVSHPSSNHHILCVCAVYCVLCAVCCALCTVYCVLYTVCCVLCAVCSCLCLRSALSDIRCLISWSMLVTKLMLLFLLLYLYSTFVFLFLALLYLHSTFVCLCLAQLLYLHATFVFLSLALLYLYSTFVFLCLA